MPGKKTTETVLVICSHSESSEWTQQMMRPITELAAERPDIRIYPTYLRMTSLNGIHDLESRKSEIFGLFGNAPSLVILLGGSSYGLALDVQNKWPGIPIIMAGENDYYCDMEYAISGPADPSANRYPISKLKDQKVNLTLIHTPALVEQTVDMMFQIQPQMSKFIFVAGENFQCKEQQLRLENYLANTHSDVPYRVISSANTSTEQLIEFLDEEADPNTAIYYGSWLAHKDYLETINLRHNTLHIIEAIAPVYTMFGCEFDKYHNVIGYYAYSPTRYNRTMRQRILNVLDEGMQPKAMSFVRMDDGAPSLNYHAMDHFGLSTDLIPETAETFYAPSSMWKDHRKDIMVTALIMLLCMGLFAYFVMTKSLLLMRKAKEAEQRGNQMKTAFIQNLSHEIRTPLNSIIGFSQLLCMPDGANTEEEKNEYMEYVMNNSQLLTVMINDMLSISDMETGQYNINIGPCNLNEMARLAIKSIEYRLPPEIEIVRKPGLREDKLYITDGLRVQQVLINFLTNAIKYSGKGKITIGSTLTEIPGCIVFYVADEGPGVPPEKAEDIFERFTKLDNSKQGAGLGLSICRIIAGNLGGKVWVDPTYTDGARFVLSIPMIEA